MFRTPIGLSYLKRNLRPLYANTQATPQSLFVDTQWDKHVDIYPGMVVVKTTGDMVTLAGGATAQTPALGAGATPYGLANFFLAPALGIDDITPSGVNACSVWVLGPDAKFEVLAPAFDTSVPWVDPGDGTTVLIGAYTAGVKQGQLVPIGTASAGGNTVGTVPIARLLIVNSASKITIGGLQGRVA